MVEGAVVLPVLAVFFGIMMLVHNTALAKLEVQSETRFAAFDNAGHACIGSGSIAEIIGVPSGPIPFWADADDKDKEESLKNIWIETHANKTRVAVALGRTQTVRGGSHLYCNPYQFGMNLLGGWAAANMGLAWGIMKMAKFVKFALKYLPLFGNGNL